VGALALLMALAAYRLASAVALGKPAGYVK